MIPDPHLMVRNYHTTQGLEPQNLARMPGFPGNPARRFDSKMATAAERYRAWIPSETAQVRAGTNLGSEGRRQSYPWGITPPSRGRCGKWGDSHVVRLTPFVQFTGIQGVGRP